MTGHIILSYTFVTAIVNYLGKILHSSFSYYPNDEYYGTSKYFAVANELKSTFSCRSPCAHVQLFLSVRKR